MAASTASTTSSGYSSQLSPSVNEHFACYWLDSCRGRHELNDCSHWREEVRGKLGIYYSPSGIFKRFAYDHISGVNLEHNPTGCTTVHLLIYTIRSQGEKEILFGISERKDTDNETNRRPLLSFPLSKPRKRSEYGTPIAQRAFEWVTNRTDISQQGLKSRFLYQHANLIYPLYLTNEQADILTQKFVPNEQLFSLHWFPVTTVLERLPEWKNYLTDEATSNKLAQHEHITPTGIQLGEHYLWSVTAACLMCIREHVPGGFETFLQV
jgi:hypothetical protein